jgi:hypothetical protein
MLHEKCSNKKDILLKGENYNGKDSTEIDDNVADKDDYNKTKDQNEAVGSTHAAEVPQKGCLWLVILICLALKESASQ